MRHSPLLLSILAALSACDDTFKDTGCLEVPAEQTTCAIPGDVDKSKLFIPNKCGDLEVVEILGNGQRGTTAADVGDLETCCYRVEVVDHTSGECVIGRPFYQGGRTLLAPLRESDGATLASASPRALAWARAGAAEHASVAAFSRLALELMAFGAPTALLRAVHQAALDEVGHADLCWTMAELCGGSRVTAAEFPLGRLSLAGSLAALATAAVREGCLAETLGAHVGSAAAELSPEPDVKAALTTIAREESNHAVLSFRIVAWALQVGGAEVKSAVAAAFAEPWPRLDVAELALRSNVDVSLLAAAAEQGVREVLEPAAARVLAA